MILTIKNHQENHHGLWLYYTLSDCVALTYITVSTQYSWPVIWSWRAVLLTWARAEQTMKYFVRLTITYINHGITWLSRTPPPPCMSSYHRLDTG